MLFLAFSSIAAFSLGEFWATGVEFVWLNRIYDQIPAPRLLLWAVLINFVSTCAGAGLALLFMPIYFKYFGVGELTLVWVGAWFVLMLIPAYLLTVYIEYRLLLWLQRGRQQLACNRLMRNVLAMNGVSFIGLALIFILFLVAG